MGNPRYANGHRRREVRARLLATGGCCPWGGCPWPSDRLGDRMARELHHHDPRHPEVDEILPISFGGSPVDLSNLRLMHRWCNQQRGAGREPARTEPRPPVIASPGWGPRA